MEHAAACTSLLQTCKELKPAPIQTARAALETVRSEALAVFTVVAVAERGLADAAAEADRLAKLTDAARQARAKIEDRATTFDYHRSGILSTSLHT